MTYETKTRPIAAAALTIAALISPVAQAHTEINRINSARLYGQWESICNGYQVEFLTRSHASVMAHAAMSATTVEVTAGALYFLKKNHKCWQILRSFDWWVQ